jgi:hypothetical protein
VRWGINVIWQPGDIMFFWGRGIGRVISGYTWGPSHVGIVCDFKFRGFNGDRTDRLLAESTTLIKGSPCRIRGVLWAGVQAQPVTQRIEAYRHSGGHVELWRSTIPWRPEDLDTLSEYAFAAMGTPYDMEQAVVSGTWWLQRKLAQLGIGAADSRKLFCSEFVANCLKKTGHGSNDWNTSKLTPSGLKRWLWWTGNGEKVCEWGPVR